MVEVVVTREFEGWYASLDETTSDAVHRVVDLLEARGTSLGFPYSSQLKGAQYGMRELRVQAAGRPIRIAYAFDPKRQAVVLLGADKTGDDRFYPQFIRDAERLMEEYLKTM
ncbi:MAG: type II toxin-antitoxin system RelE/ParE family toxin [bacterium]|nr:type II toxin-antitoxin system RelE/ParE family toxin [bacterium]